MFSEVNIVVDNKVYHDLLPIQERIYIAQNSKAKSSLFNLGGHWVVPDIEANKLINSIKDVISNDSVFFLNFELSNNKIKQYINANKCFLKPVKETFNSKAEVLKYINHLMDIPFNLKENTLFRVFHCIDCSNQLNYVGIIVHHIIIDGQSLPYLFSRLENKINYGFDNYSKKENNFLVKLDTYKKKASNLDYWLPNLKSALSNNAFNSILKKSSDISLTKSINKSISTDKLEEIRNFCFKNNLSINNFFIATTFLLNHLYGNDSFVLGFTLGNRKRKESVIGPLVDILPISIEVEPDERITEYYLRTKSKIFELYRNKDVNTSELYRKIGKGLPYNILFEYRPSQSNFTIESKKYHVRTLFSNYQQEDLIIRINEDINSLNISFNYKISSFKDADISKLMFHFIHTINNVLKNGNIAIKNLNVLSKDEKKNIIHELNNTSAPYNKELCIQHLIDQQLKIHSKNSAIIFEQNSLGYEDFIKKTNHFSRFLIENGAEKNKFVAVYMERSIDMVLSLISILKSGSAYVPIDTSLPEERLIYVLNDVNPKIIITQTKFEDKIRKITGSKVIAIDNPNLKLSKNAQKDLKITAENRWAYMIYTSGSTGKPKGVINSHNALYNRIIWMQKKLNASHKDVFLQKTPYSFDVSVWEFIWPFTLGAKLVICKPEGHKDPIYLQDLIYVNKVTILHFVPSMLRIFLKHAKIEKLKSLSKVICSGEELSIELQNSFFSILPGVELYNFYGPTEAAIDVTFWKCKKLNKSILPIGKPIDNTQLYVLGKQKQLLPKGCSGELHIAGDSLAIGYHNNPKLTKEKFITINIENSETRMYKTGDLVRWNEDNNLEYLGRIDFQVKINGIRIELNEIEYYLEELNYINAAKVIDVEEPNGTKRLVAYIILENKNSTIESGSIIKHLKKKLPLYMIPQIYMEIDDFPLNSNGKIDRKSLPKWKKSDEKVKNATTKKEKYLVGKFEEILGIKGLGVNSDFFATGGTSLQALEFSSITGFSTDELYSKGTVEELLSDKKTKEFKYLCPLFLHDNSNMNLICIPYGGGDAIVYKDLSDTFKNNSSVFAINPIFHLDKKNLDIEKEAKLYAIEIAKLKGEIILYGHCVGSAMAIAIRDYLENNNTKVKLVVIGGASPFLPRGINGFITKSSIRLFYFNKITIEFFLRSIGGKDLLKLKKTQKNYILNKFRFDGNRAMNYFKKVESKISKSSIPLIIITGDDDILTKKRKFEVKKWNHFSEKTKYYSLFNANHYFNHTHPKMIKEIILNNLN
jgi:amino acid adenylation domain-containing protein